MPTMLCQPFADRAAEEYWTEERIATAIPVSSVALAEGDLVEETPPVVAPDHDEVTIEAGPDPATATQRSAPAAGPGTTVPEGVPQLATNPPEYHVPFWNCGRWLFRDPATNRAYSCTASFVASPNVLMTAAHCVINPRTGKWYDNFSFIRAAIPGSGPQVVYPKEICIYQEAFAGGRFNAVYDYAFASTYQTSGAGWLGFCLPPPAYSLVTAVGYPSCFGGDPNNPDCVGGGGTLPPYPGYMYWDNGTLGATTVKGTSVMNNNPMQHGASGGPWIYRFSQVTSAGGNNMAVGLTSFGTTRTDVNGPPFTMDTYTLLTHLINTA